MRSRKHTFRLFLFAVIAAAAAIVSSGCGGSMASSSTAWLLDGFTPYGSNPSVEIVASTGTSPGSYLVQSSSMNSDITVNTQTFLLAAFSVEVRNVNAAAYTSASPQAVGSLSAVWSQVLPTGQTTPTASFNSVNGTTFTNLTSVAPNVLLLGQCGNYVTTAVPGPITVKLHVTLQTSDGSTTTHDFYSTINVAAAGS